jgi:hypothetical protein
LMIGHIFQIPQVFLVCDFLSFSNGYEFLVASYFVFLSPFSHFTYTNITMSQPHKLCMIPGKYSCTNP